MELDQTIVTDEEIDYWCKEFPDLDREEVIGVLSVIEIGKVKDEYWRDNPTLEESEVNKVVALNAAASYEYHLYNDLNYEAQ